MKTVLILINVRWWNATAFYAVNTARVLRNNRVRVIIGSKPGSPPYEKAKDYGFDVREINFEGYNIVKLLKNFIKMINIVREEKVDVINGHRSEDHTFGSLCKLFTARKFIITRGDRRRIKPNIFSKMIYGSADSIILTAKSIYRQNEKFLKRFRDKIHIIYGSVDEDNFRVQKSKRETAKKYGIDLRKKIIGMAGRLDYVKDQYTFVKAASIVVKKISNVQFIIAGKEEHIKVSELKKMATVLDVDKNLKIFTIIDDIADMINLFDIAVITSVDSETISRVVLEYIYLGKPVVGTNVNVIPEIIHNGENGIIIQPQDSSQLADAILKLLKNSSFSKNMGVKSNKRYEKYFSDKRFFQELLTLI